jgi:hypothetical protein
VTNTSTTEQYVQVLITEADVTAVTIVEQSNLVTIDEDDPTVVYVSTTGTRGPGIISGTTEPTISDGLIGDIYVDRSSGGFWGPKTSSGWGASPFYTQGLTLRYVHYQASAASTWTINHTLGGYPSVMVVDTASTVVIGEVLYLSTSQVRVSFSSPFSGYAYLT